MATLVYFLSIVFVGALGKNLKTACPPPEDLPLCTCHNREPLWFTCKNIMHVWDMKSIASYLSNYKVEHLRLENSFLMYLPKGMFVNLHIDELEIHNSEILGMESDDGNEMFKGLENSLLRLYFYNTTGMDTWKWSALTSLNTLKTLFIKRSDLTKIDKDFASVSPESVVLIQLLGNKIKHIYPNAFQNHIELYYLDLAENQITEINRSMLPKPAKDLSGITLEQNKIEVIPEDFFTEMPVLRNIKLGWNNIKFLSPELFLPLENKEKLFFDIRFNNIHCCSTSKFLIKAAYRKSILGACQFPKVLQDKPITDLKEVDLDHGIC